MSTTFTKIIISIFIVAILLFTMGISGIEEATAAAGTGSFESICSTKPTHEQYKLAAYRVRNQDQIIRIEALSDKNNIDRRWTEAKINNYQNLDELEVKLISATRLTNQ